MTGDKLNARDRQIAALVAAGQTYGETATRLGLSERTVCRAMSRDAVRKLVDSIRDERVSAVVGTLGELSGTAAATLQGLMESGTQAVKLGAARAVFDYLIRGREHAQLAREIAELRKQCEEPAFGSDPAPEDRGGPADHAEGAGDAGGPADGPDGCPDPGWDPP